MKSKLLDQSESRTFVVVFEKGDEVVEQLLSFARDNDLRGSSFTAIGAFSDVTVAFFDRQTKDYLPIRIDEQVEVLSLIGNIALTDSGPKVHAHVVIGKSDGTAYGGHLLEAHVWPTLEVVLTEWPTHPQRKIDEETGLPLLAL